LSEKSLQAVGGEMEARFSMDLLLFFIVPLLFFLSLMFLDFCRAAGERREAKRRRGRLRRLRLWILHGVIFFVFCFFGA